MEIITEGIGEKYVFPDGMTIFISFNIKGENFKDAEDNGSLTVFEYIQNIIDKNDIDRTKLKTKSYLVYKNRKWNEEEKRYKDDGYMFNQDLIIKLDLDVKLLSKIMEDSTNIDNPPNIDVSFFIKNSKVYQDEILGLAFNDAKNKAEIIARSNNSTIKECTKTTTIVNDNSNRVFMSEARSSMMAKTFIPEDIKLRTIINTTWITD